MQLSVIILNYNVRYFLELCLQSVVRAVEGLDAEIIVVDNHSPDDSCAMVRERFPSVRLIEHPENSGFPKGNNIGVAQARGQYLCILNPDTVVAEDTFSKVLSFIEGLKNPGIVGVRLIDGTGNFLPESKRGIPTPWVAFTKIFGLYKIFPNWSRMNRYYAGHLPENQTGKVDILVGAFMFLTRDLYNELGGFDENCFMYADDIDLSYRALLLQKENWYYPGTTVIHYKGESTVKDATYMKHFRDFLNFFYQKHFSRSLFFDLMAKAGAVYFALVKRVQGKPKPKAQPEAHILCPPNAPLQQKIENAMSRKVMPTEMADFPKTIAENGRVRVIFDSSAVDFSQQILAMQQYKSPSVTYRITAQTADFMLGSDSSNDRGEVVLFR